MSTPSVSAAASIGCQVELDTGAALASGVGAAAGGGRDAAAGARVLRRVAAVPGAGARREGRVGGVQAVPAQLPVDPWLG